MSKQLFIQTVENLFATNEIPAEAMDYFNKTVKSKKVNKKEVEKATVLKDAILKFLTDNQGKMFDRIEIGDALYNAGEFDEEFLLNEKGTVAYNSITAFANQLVDSKQITKDEIKVGKVKKIKYRVA